MPSQKLSKIVSMLLVSSVILAMLLSCTHTVPDVPYCIETSPISGHCFMTTSSLEFNVDVSHLWTDTDGTKKDWVEIKNSSLIFPASSYGALKLFIINECNDVKNCSGLTPAAKQELIQKLERTDQALRML